jgi:carbonic anhydrase
MDDLQKLLDNNARWAAEAVTRDPQFFQRLTQQQRPEYLWIGCSDSRVPANEIVALPPGEVFVHRNVGNVVAHSDLNCQSVIQFAVDVLKVRHIMVVGHYGCSGVHAALHESRIGIADHWLGHVRDVASRYKDLLDREPKDSYRESLLCELNVLEQALNVCGSTVVQDAWTRGQKLSVHGWIYRLGDGRLRHLDFSISERQDTAALRARAVRQVLDARARYAAAHAARS